ncbi:MAG: zinc ABC transporter substrate-binding protein, partial [Clostridiales bacterium]|nr:zinc ABC transporter substrate-binding protein [Clostridiales bacterium]
DAFEKNSKAYIEKLDALDKEYEAAVAEGSIKTVLFGDRFPFRYLVDDYGLTYYAAFIGCSAETEASFETIAFLSEKVNELNLHTILTIEGSDQKIAKTIVENTSSKDQKIMVLDSMQSVTSKDVKDGENYYSVMEKNLEVLKEALK